MVNPIFTIAKAFLSRISVDAYQRPLAYAIQSGPFAEVRSTPTFTKREELWLENVPRNESVTLVEFGVHNGYSLNYFSQYNRHPDSRFIGLDSFEGLPENWGSMKAGTFSRNGEIPTSTDSRLSFIKGWFQDTWDELNASLINRTNIIIHYDADLYSSTLFALTKIDSLRANYTAIFDEFWGHETRALYNYMQAYGASISFLGKTQHNGYPAQVACRISPRLLKQERTHAASI